MVSVLKVDAERYAKQALEYVRKQRRLEMFKSARKYHKPPYIKKKLALWLFKFFDNGLGDYRSYETSYWRTESDAEHLLKKCCVEISDTIILDTDEVNLIAKMKKCGGLKNE